MVFAQNRSTMLPEKKPYSVKKRKSFELKFIYSERATKFCEISTLLLSVCTVDKSKVEISQTFVAFSEYTNFTENSKLMSFFQLLKGGSAKQE